VVHHKDKNISNNVASNLETLCRACHRQEHSDEIAEAQRRPEVNARRGASVSAARTGKHYPKASEAVRKKWQGPAGDKLRAHRSSDENKARISTMMRAKWASPEYREKRRIMKELRNGKP
jgi:hypothetical protein